MRSRDAATYRVVLADDQPEVRTSVRRFMEKDGRFDVVAEVEDGAEAIACVLAEQPDGLVLDLAMPGIDGLQALEKIRSEAPGVSVVVVSSMVPFSGIADQVIAAGAVAVFDKYASPKKVIKALMQSVKRSPSAASRA